MASNTEMNSSSDMSVPPQTEEINPFLMLNDLDIMMSSLDIGNHQGGEESGFAKSGSTEAGSGRTMSFDEMLPLEVFEWEQDMETEFYEFLSSFLLCKQEMVENGYPYENDLGQVEVFKTDFWARDRKPGKKIRNTRRNKPWVLEKTCVRCDKGFFITNHRYVSDEPCRYHWGKCERIKAFTFRFSCCNFNRIAPPCTKMEVHVWDGIDVGVNGPLTGYVSTKGNKNRKRTVYALDCEMCYTVRGLELCRVTVLAFDGRIVYNHYVRPEKNVVDFATRWSGVTEKDMSRPDTKTFSEVQQDLLKLFTEDSILIGHSLENDLRVLKMVHTKLVDTSLVFKHNKGPPYKNSLKRLMLEHIGKPIQESTNGHNPYEDAYSCLELMAHKLKEISGGSFNLTLVNTERISFSND